MEKYWVEVGAQEYRAEVWNEGLRAKIRIEEH